MSHSRGNTRDTVRSMLYGWAPDGMSVLEIRTLADTVTAAMVEAESVVSQRENPPVTVEIHDHRGVGGAG